MYLNKNKIETLKPVSLQKYLLVTGLTMQFEIMLKCFYEMEMGMESSDKGMR